MAGYVRDPAPGTPTPGLGPAERPPRELALPAAHDILVEPSPRVLGEIEDLPAILHGMVVDEVAICLPPEALAFLEPVARLCQDEGKIVRIPLDQVGLSLPGGTVDAFDGIPVLSLVHGPDRAVALIVKRAVDVVGSLAALIVLSPLLAVTALAIAIADGRPILYRQERVGLHGRPFRVVKFRSMVRDAEARLAALATDNEINGHAFKLTVDPRVTRLGGFLRRTSIDELPQLWNVLRGQMSLVGPRPPLPDEVARYDIWHRRRLAMKPGITGLWQVSARREAEFDRWVRLDLDYIDRWSLALDLRDHAADGAGAPPGTVGERGGRSAAQAARPVTSVRGSGWATATRPSRWRRRSRTRRA